jgi:hypothetical protein
VFVGPPVVALAVAVWGVVRLWQAASVGAETQSAIAIGLGASLFLCLWVWYRARPGSDKAPPQGTMDAVLVAVAPGIALLTAAMLLDKLPRVFWPAAEGLQRAGSIAGLVVITGLVVIQVRRIVIELHRRRAR